MVVYLSLCNRRQNEPVHRKVERESRGRSENSMLELDSINQAHRVRTNEISRDDRVSSSRIVDAVSGAYSFGGECLQNVKCAASLRQPEMREPRAFVYWRSGGQRQGCRITKAMGKTGLQGRKAWESCFNGEGRYFPSSLAFISRAISRTVWNFKISNPARAEKAQLDSYLGDI